MIGDQGVGIDIHGIFYLEEAQNAKVAKVLAFASFD